MKVECKSKSARSHSQGIYGIPLGTLVSTNYKPDEVYMVVQSSFGNLETGLVNLKSGWFARPSWVSSQSWYKRDGTLHMENC